MVGAPRSLTPFAATSTVRAMSGSRAAATTFPMLFLLAVGGCQPSGYARTAADAEMFGAQAVRIHPTFTRAKDWNGDGNPDGIEAVLELQDEFGEPTRATGRAQFEIYQYRPYYPDPRGKRLQQTWEWALNTRQEQVDHWSRALRAYTFKIPYDPGNHSLVLAATFELGGGTPRLFDQIILEPSGRTTPAASAPVEGAPPGRRPDRPRRRELPAPTTQPTTAPDSTPDATPDLAPTLPPDTTPAAPEGGGAPDAVPPAQ